MLYKILLSIQYEPLTQHVRHQISDNLRSKNWKSLTKSELSWVAEVISNDLLSAKLRVERDLNNLYSSLRLSHLNYAFQLSLGNVSTGTLKPKCPEVRPRKVFSLKESSEDLLMIWERRSQQKTNLCCENLCTKTDIEGTMVHCLSTNKNYLIPLCTEHRNSDNELTICSCFDLIEYP